MNKKTVRNVLKRAFLVLEICCFLVLFKKWIIDDIPRPVSSAEAKTTAEQYSDYGYTQEELDLITEDIKCGRDVSSYIEKGQSSEEFAAARNAMFDVAKENLLRIAEVVTFMVMWTYMIYGSSIKKAVKAMFVSKEKF